MMLTFVEAVRMTRVMARGIGALAVCVALQAVAPGCGLAQTKWQVASEPQISIILEDAAAVAGATRLPSGHFAVADAIKGLSLFDPKGRLVWTARQRADADLPLEPTWVSACGRDSLYVWDAAGSRLSVLDRSGIPVREVKLPPRTLTWAARCSSTGDFAFPSMPRLAPKGRSMIDPSRPYSVLPVIASVLVTDSEGRQKGTIQNVGSGEIIAARPSGGRALGGPRPLSGTMLVAYAGSSLMVAEPESLRVGVYDRASQLVKWLSLKPIAGGPSVDAYRRESRAIVPTFPGAARSETLALFDSLAPPKVTPAAIDLFGDPDGGGWIVTTEGGPMATVLRRIGEADATLLRIPRALRVLEIGPQYLLGLENPGGARSQLVLFKLARSQ